MLFTFRYQYILGLYTCSCYSLQIIKLTLAFYCLHICYYQVDIDFTTLYPDVTDNLFLKFTPSLAKQVLDYAELQGSQLKTYLQNGVEIEIESGIY